MSTSSFTESGLRFQFPADWKVLKYDEHRFYRYLSGSGLKGVDFIVIREGELILIEVKNYRERLENERFYPVETLMETPDIYVEKVIRKFEDTFRLLRVIKQYYRRKWWYQSIFHRFKNYLPEKWLLKTEFGFWSNAISLLKKNKQVKLVLWMELPPEFTAKKVKRIHSYFQVAIETKVPKDMVFSIVDSKAVFAGVMVEII